MKRLYVILGILIISVSCSYGDNHKDILIERAEHGDLSSQKYLANVYLNGKGIYKKNHIESYKWISKAAEQGDPESQYLLFKYLEQGIGCEKRLEFDVLYKSAEQHFAPALLTLGQYCNPVPGQQENARKYLFEALELGEKSALLHLGLNYINSGDFQKGVECYYKATKECVDEDKAFAFAMLASCYKDGIGVNINFKEAHNLIDKSLDMYSIAGYWEIKGEIYLREGKIKEATKMWNKVCELSLAFAQESTSELARAMNQSIDYGIPNTSKVNEKTYAIVIANENYKRVPNVPYAINDGKIFHKYLMSSFGVPEGNIEFLEDASLNDIKYALGNVAQRCQAFKDQCSVIVYYAGHGVPDDKTAEAFLLPVDGFGTDPSSGLNLDDFYATLSEMQAKSVVVLLDACFSGAKRDGGMLMATRGITIKPKMHVPDGKLIVLSATSNEETAFPIEDQKHGLFTYTLLRKIQETGGDITWGELADHVSETVKNRSIDLNGKLQTPTVSVSSSMKEIWRNLKLR